MLSKVDLQLFRASLRAISSELHSLPKGAPVPDSVFQELSCMDLVIERSQTGDHDLKWLGGFSLPRSK